MVKYQGEKIIKHTWKVFCCLFKVYLEPKLLEEPFVLATLVSLLETDSCVETELLAFRGVLQVLCTELLEAEVN